MLRKNLSIVQQRNAKSIEKESVSGSRFKLDGGGRKFTDVELEEEVLNWIQKRRSDMLRVSIKLIMFKAKYIYNEKCGDNEELKAGFVAKNG